MPLLALRPLLQPVTVHYEAHAQRLSCAQSNPSLALLQHNPVRIVQASTPASSAYKGQDKIMTKLLSAARDDGQYRQPYPSLRKMLLHSPFHLLGTSQDTTKTQQSSSSQPKKAASRR